MLLCSAGEQAPDSPARSDMAALPHRRGPMDGSDILSEIAGTRIDHWKYSHKDHHGEPVTHGATAFNVAPQTVRVEFRFDEDGNSQHILGERHVNGSAAQITLNG